MKGALVVTGLVALAAAAGVGWAVRRQPPRATLEDTASGFAVNASGAGRFIQYQDLRTPLRAFRWLPPLPGGVLVAQILGQNDRQRLAWFRDGADQGLVLVTKPVGISDGFWRFANLDAALPGPDGTLVLAYRAEPGSGSEPPVVLGLDPAGQQVRWWYRGDFERMALGPDASLYLYAARGPVLRLALAKAAGALAAAESLDPPAEVASLEALLPTGPGRLLVAHAGGLAAYRPGAGWITLPAPEPRGVPCQDWKPGLAQAGADFWWQPAPGGLVRVRADGRIGSAWQAQLPEGDPFAPDAQLLRLLGAAPDGSLWFDLASPAATAPVAPGAPAAPEPAPAPAGPEAAPAPPLPAEAPVAGVDWAAYRAQGLDRIYRWRPGSKGLERLALGQAWAALQPPPAVAPPGSRRLAPAAGALAAEGNRCAWWLPLSALPFAQAR